MNFKSILGAVACLGIGVFIFSVFNNSNSEKKHVEALLTKAEELHKNRKLGADETIFKNILEELDKKFVPVSASRKIYRQVSEIRYLDYLVLEIDDYIVDAQPFKADQRLGKLFLYLENNPGHLRYGYYKQQAERLKSAVEELYDANDNYNKSMVSYFKIWLGNCYRFEGHFPQDLDEFRTFIRDYSLNFPTSYHFDSYILSEGLIEVLFTDKSVNRQYQLNFSY